MKAHKLGKDIVLIRNKGRLTQVQLADQLGINVRTLARWESGEGSPKDGVFDEIVRICQKSYPEAFTSYLRSGNINNENHSHYKNAQESNVDHHALQGLLEAKEEVIQLQKEIIQNLKNQIKLKKNRSKSKRN